MKPRFLGANDGVTVTLWRARHEAWHQLFWTLSLDDIIELLERRQINGYWIADCKYSHHVGDDDWKRLFRTLDIHEATALLKRLRTMKYN